MSTSSPIQTNPDYKKDPRFSFLFNSGLMGVVFTHLTNGKVIKHEANDAFLSMIGYSKDEVESDPQFLIDITTPAYKGISKAVIGSLHSETDFNNYEKEYVHKNGSIVHVIGSTKKINDELIVAFINDITKQRRAEEQVKATESLFKSFSSSGIVGINFWNTSGKMWGVNAAYTDIHGYTEEDVTASDFEWSKIPVKGEEYKFADGVQKVLQGETVKPYATQVRHKNGHIVDILVGYALIEGSASEGICVTLDISREKKMERALMESEERFRFIYESNLIGVSFATFHSDGTVSREANDAFFQMIGYEKTDFVNDPHLWDKIIVAEYTDARDDTWKKLLSTRQKQNVTLRYYRKDRSIATVMVHSTILRDDLATAIIIDISDQVAAEEALQKSEERFKNMVDQSPTMTFIGDLDSNVTYVNTAIVEFTGLSFDHFIGDGWTQSIHPDDAERLYTGWKQAVQKRSDYAVSFRMKKADGNYRHIDAFSKPMFYDNEIQGYVGVLVDVSDQMEAAKAVKELLRKKDEFLSIASHELKTPLTSIKASTQLLGELLKAGEQELLPQYLKKADKQLDKLVQLINELLDVSKIDAGKMDMHYESFDAVELLETTKEYLLASNKKYSVKRFAVTHPVVADKGRIEQVIYNFLSNAVKYSPANEELSISLTGNEHSFKFSVKDTGTGIPREKLNLIFERFYRADESGGKPGLGLGLYISSEIIKKHNGFITVESELKKGSVFSFTIPFSDLKKLKV